MPAPEADRVRYAFHRPRALPELTILCVTSDGPFSRSFPDKYSSVLHVSGRSDWSMRSTRWSSEPGMIGVKIPGEVYAERARRGVARFEVMKFDDALVDDARAVLGLRLGAPKQPVIDGRDPRVQPLAALHRRALDASATRAELEQALCEALTALIELVSVDHAGAPLAAASAAVARARALLDAHLTDTVSLDELAAHARLDKYHLCRAFRNEVGLPPHAYVTQRRISAAQALLARGLSQAEVATSVGLYDQSQLHRHFKRIFGMTPGAYAQAVR